MNFQVPLNRWTVGTALIVVAFFGEDLMAPVLKAIAILSQSHVPAV